MQPSVSPAQPKLMLLHGLVSSPQEFGLIRLGLKGHGIDLQCPELPSYTLALDPVHQSWRQWRAAARQALDIHGKDAPVVLGGLCVGGVLAAATALENPERVAGVVMMAPSFAYDSWGMSPIRHLRHLGYWTGLDRFFSVTEREPFGIRNEKMRKWVVQQLRERAQSAVGPAKVPLRALREADRMMAHVAPRLSQLRCPIMVMHSRDDEITRLSTIERVFHSLPQKDKEMVVLENSYHMITIDNDRQQVAAKLHEFAVRCAALPQQEIVGEPVAVDTAELLRPLPALAPA